MNRKFYDINNKKNFDLFWHLYPYFLSDVFLYKNEPRLAVFKKNTDLDLKLELSRKISKEMRWKFAW